MPLGTRSLGVGSWVSGSSQGEDRGKNRAR